MTTVSHREFIKDIVSSATAGAFNNESFPIQPGNSLVFPWLSTIAQNYEQYYIHGIQFLFRSSAGDNTTTGAAGNVILAAEYNVNATAYTNKQFMENSVGAKSVKQQNSAIFTVATVDNVFFTRDGSIPANDSLKFYDHSIFQIATQGFPTASFNAGELWVAYKITFLKPQIPRVIGGTPEFGRLVRLGAGTAGGTANYYGTTATGNSNGSVSITVSGSPVNTVTLSNLSVGNVYVIYHHWFGAGTVFAAPTYGGYSAGIALRNLYIGGTQPSAVGGGGNTTNASSSLCIQANADVCSFSITGGTIPSASTLDVLVLSVDPAGTFP